MGGVYSCDKIQLVYRLRFGEGQELLDQMARQGWFEYDHWESRKFGTYRNQFSVKCGADGKLSYWLGVGMVAYGKSRPSDTEKQKSAFCADGCTLRTRTGTGSRLHRFRRWSLSTTEIINLHKIPVDLILFADTGGEQPHTYEFIRVFNAWLDKHGLPKITPVFYTDKDGNRLTLEEECFRSHTLPSIAYGFKKCSLKHKIGTQEKFCNHYIGGKDHE